MNKTINQSLNKYKELLHDYLLWADKTKRKYGWKPGKEFDNINLSTSDWNRAYSMSEALRTVENVLGLTKKEIEVIEHEILAEINK